MPSPPETKTLVGGDPIKNALMGVGRAGDDRSQEKEKEQAAANAHKGVSFPVVIGSSLPGQFLMYTDSIP